MDQRERRGLQDGGDRSASIARWLAQAPASEAVTELVLYARAGDDDESVITRFPRARVTRELAPELSALVQDYADDVGGQVSARLQWQLEDGRPWTAKALRARPMRSQSGRDIPIEPFDGSRNTDLQQNQRHTEILLRQLIEREERHDHWRDRSEERAERMFAQYERTLEMLRADVDRARAEAEQVAAEAATATQLADEAMGHAEEAVQAAEAAGKDDKFAQVLEMVPRALAAGLAQP